MWERNEKNSTKKKTSITFLFTLGLGTVGEGWLSNV